MGHYEDFWWEITESINNKGLKKEFDDSNNVNVIIKEEIKST